MLSGSSGQLIVHLILWKIWRLSDFQTHHIMSSVGCNWPAYLYYYNVFLFSHSIYVCHSIRVGFNDNWSLSANHTKFLKRLQTDYSQNYLAHQSPELSSSVCICINSRFSSPYIKFTSCGILLSYHEFMYLVRWFFPSFFLKGLLVHSLFESKACSQFLMPGTS